MPSADDARISRRHRSRTSAVVRARSRQTSRDKQAPELPQRVLVGASSPGLPGDAVEYHAHEVLLGADVVVRRGKALDARPHGFGSGSGPAGATVVGEVADQPKYSGWFFDVGEQAAVFERVEPNTRVEFHELALQASVQRTVVAPGEHHDWCLDPAQPGRKSGIAAT